MRGGRLQSIIALLGGFAIMVFLSIGLTIVEVAVLGVESGAPTRAYLAANLCVSALAALAGGFSTAALAPVRPRAHTVGLVVMVLVMTLSSLKNAHAGQPAWYRGALVFTGPSFALIGGLLRRSRRARTTP